MCNDESEENILVINKVDTVNIDSFSSETYENSSNDLWFDSNRDTELFLMIFLKLNGYVTP